MKKTLFILLLVNLIFAGGMSDSLKLTKALETARLRITTAPLDTAFLKIDPITNLVKYDTNNYATHKTLTTGIVDYIFPEITDNGNGTITLAATSCNIRDNATLQGRIITLPVAQATLTLTDWAQEYITIQYNAGTASYVLTNDKSIINYSNIIGVAAAWHIGAFVRYTPFGSNGAALSNKINSSIIQTTPFRRSIDGGLMIGEVPTRYITLTSSIVYVGTTPISLPAFNSSTDSMYFFYRSGGTWAYTLTHQYDNTQYDNGTNLVTSIGNKYLVRFMYRTVGSSQRIYYVSAISHYANIAAAEAATIPSNLPLVISGHCMLVGRVIVQGNATSATSISSAFTTQFGSTAVSDHQSLSNLNGDSPYYHISQNNYNFLSTLTDTVQEQLNNKQQLNSILTSISGLNTGLTGLIKLTNGTASLDVSTYLKTAVTSLAANTPLSTTAATGSIVISHNETGISQGTYKSVTVNTYGHVTAGSNPTTLLGYGITDALQTGGTVGSLPIWVGANDLSATLGTSIFSSDGKAILLSPNVTGSNYNDGLRIARSTAGYSVLSLGCAAGSYAGTQVGQWNIYTDNAAAGYKLIVSNNADIITSLTPSAYNLGINLTGSMATPYCLDLGLSYSNGATYEKIKLALYHNSTSWMGFGIGSATDIQYHISFATGAHDFYINNTKRLAINSDSIYMTPAGGDGIAFTGSNGFMNSIISNATTSSVLDLKTQGGAISIYGTGTDDRIQVDGQTYFQDSIRTDGSVNAQYGIVTGKLLLGELLEFGTMENTISYLNEGGANMDVDASQYSCIAVSCSNDPGNTFTFSNTNVGRVIFVHAKFASVGNCKLVLYSGNLTNYVELLPGETAIMYCMRRTITPDRCYWQIWKSSGIQPNL
jgi:hypothetical protein